MIILINLIEYQNAFKLNFKINSLIF